MTIRTTSPDRSPEDDLAVLRAEERLNLALDMAGLIAGAVLSAGLIRSGLFVLGEHYSQLPPLAQWLVWVGGAAGALCVGGLAERLVSRLVDPVRVEPTRCTNRRP